MTQDLREPLWSIEQLAEYFSFAPTPRFRQWALDRFPVVRVRRAPRWIPAEVRQWVADNREGGPILAASRWRVAE